MGGSPPDPRGGGGNRETAAEGKASAGTGAGSSRADGRLGGGPRAPVWSRTDKGRVESQTIGRQVPAEIVDYFGSEIFRRLDGERRDFLLRTAFLPRMTPSMAEKLTGAERAGPILSEMNRQNQFTKKYPQREPVYEYHDLFREFLLQRAGSAFSMEEFASIRRAAAALLEQAGYVEDAAVLFRESGDWKELSQLILSQGRSLVAQGRYQTLLEWLGALPKEVLDADPWLLYWKGVCLMPFSPGESRARFEEALGKFDARREAPGVFRSWSGVVESIITPVENLTPLDGWISLLPRLLEKYGGLPSGEVGDIVTCSMYRALVLSAVPPGCRGVVDASCPRRRTDHYGQTSAIHVDPWFPCCLSSHEGHPGSGKVVRFLEGNAQTTGCYAVHATLGGLSGGGVSGLKRSVRAVPSGYDRCTCLRGKHGGPRRGCLPSGLCCGGCPEAS